MHHTREAKTPILKTWGDYPNVRLHVNIVYHETMRGLLNCQPNNEAVSAIQDYLQQNIRKDTGGNALGVAARSDRFDSFSDRGVGSDRVSDVDRTNSVFSRFTGKLWN